MTKKTLFILIGVITIGVISVTAYILDRTNHSRNIAYFESHAIVDTTLTVGIIGDSWVAWGILDSALHAELLKKGLKNKITSSGDPGKRSKVIYQNIFAPASDEFSSKFVVQDQPDYCIVIAGTNDLIAQIGADNYSHHLCQIIKTLLHYNIKPIIVPVPEFEVEGTINSLDLISRNRNKMFAYFNNDGEINNIQIYRQALIDSMKANNLTESIVMIDYNKVCMDYNRCNGLYKNSSHLSKRGNQVLCNAIANELYKAEKIALARY